MDLRKTDKEYYERFDRFAFDEVANDESSKLDDETRYTAILATLIGCQGVQAFSEILQKALESGMPAEKVKEIVYQATDYLGYGRMVEFLTATNEIFEKLGIEESEKERAVTTLENRLEKGIEAQVTIFGERMNEAWKAGTVNKWLASNCFGDYYTRKGMDLAEREMITFCFLYAQGGCEPQLKAHINGNINIGNSKEFLTKIVLQCVPYIGYPRSLNALNCIKEA